MIVIDDVVEFAHEERTYSAIVGSSSKHDLALCVGTVPLSWKSFPIGGGVDRSALISH